jgi:hypothetical protein
MPTQSSNLVPTSIQRIRAFLNDVCGMKVRPWAGVEETLDALHAVLVARQDCTIFWKSLHVLLERLAQDLRRREDAAPDQLIDNEVLNTDRYQSLLDEIKSALAQGRSTQGGFARLAAAVSMPAAALLLLLGGIATVGCGSHTSLSAANHDARQESTAPGDANPATTADTSVASAPDANPANTPKADSGTSPGNPDSAVIILPPAPDTATTQDSLARACDGGCSVEDIMVACGMAPATRQSVSVCIARLRDSWRAGLTSGFAARSCNDIGTILSYCLPNYCEPGAVSNSEFDPTVLDCQIPPIYPIYIGVRFA